MSLPGSEEGNDVGASAYPDFSRTGKVALCEPIIQTRKSLSLWPVDKS
jgi:hypothetical protein